MEVMEAVIQVNGLTKQFQQLTAVENLSFTVYKGDVYGFLGQNGAGKSTTIRMLLSLIMPTSGSISLFGMSLSQHRSDILRQVGAVIEKPDVYKYLSAYDNLKLFAQLSGLRPNRQQLMEQLEMVGLANRANDKVTTFSQGMKQRLGIGIALVHNPQLIVLDEPTNGLDPQGIADIRHLILRLRNELNKTIVVSSHLLSEIEQIATRILIIDKGQKLVEGDAATLFDPSQTMVEIQTLNNAAALAALHSSEWYNCLLPQRDSNALLLKVHRQQIPELHQFLAATGIGLLSLQPRNSLEDYFLQITSGKQYVPTVYH